MEVDVRGRKSSVPDVVRVQAQAKVARVGRLSPVLQRAEVRLAEDPEAPGGGGHVCEVVAEGHGHVIRARARSRDLLVAVDLAVAKLAHQAERLKGKLVGRSHPRRSRTLSKA
ncbi:MAG TPA: ribosome-associated translation inhibitor RaiA [Acidimicrobiales bacterium]|nr:ribosome-associated translation inhibitor RaiA [Acidimicrobiales bacterium]